MNAKKETQTTPRILTRQQAAAYLNVGVSTLDLLLKEIPRLKIGKLVRYRPSDLDDYINRKSQEAAS